jgi:anti-sigma B factor antagonist
MTALHLPPPVYEATVTAYVIGRRTVLRVTGEIDMGTAPELSGAVEDALAAGALELWIDLSETAFMDSSGLHVLLEARRTTDRLNRRLAIICPGGPVRRVIELAGMLDHLPVFDNRPAAHRAA